MKKIIFLTVLLCTCFLSRHVMAQTASSWTKINSQDGVNVSAKLDTCASISQKVFLIKYENTNTADSAIVDYTLQITDNPTFPPIKGIIRLGAGQSESGTCASKMFTLLFPAASMNTNVTTVKSTITVTKK